MKHVAWIILLFLAGWEGMEAQVQNDTIADQTINEVVVVARRPTVSMKPIRCLLYRRYSF